MKIALAQEHIPARPLKILVPLIKQDFEDGDKAGMPFFTAAGEKLNEARNGEAADWSAKRFYAWAEKTFGKKPTQIKTYMAVAMATSRKPFKTLDEVTRPNRPTAGYLRRDWTAPVDAVAEKARREQFRLAQDETLTRQEEREADRKLAHRLIDIGWKVLAKELHPDKLGGSREGMSRLNRVRDILKRAI